MKNKRILSKFILTTIVAMSTITPVFANGYNYEFESDTDQTFGNHTFTSDTSYYNNNHNVRKDKNYAYLPPQYGLFSGEFQTNSSNTYMPKLDNASATNNTYSVPSDSNSTGALLPSTSLMNDNSTYNNSISENVSVTNNYNGYQTESLYYSDGSIGSLVIKDYNVSVSVLEGETLENLRLGVGHFSNTSAWDGNVALAGHNRGAYGYFNALKNMSKGDEVIYTTKYGTRTYKMAYRKKISFDDMSYFNYSSENTLTLVTCVEDEPSYRYVVVFEEK